MALAQPSSDNDEDDIPDVDMHVEPIPVMVIGTTDEQSDAADYSSHNTYEVLGSTAAGGPSQAQQILGRDDKRLQALISVFDASGNNAGVYICDQKQAQSGQQNLGTFLPSGTSGWTYKGKDALFVLPSAIKSTAGDVFVGVTNQRYK